MPKVRDERLSIRASKQDKSILEQAAMIERVTMSQFIMQSSLVRAMTVLKTAVSANDEQTKFVIPADKWEELCARLDAPPREIPELRALFNAPDLFND